MSDFELAKRRPENFRRLHDWFGIWAMLESAAMGLFQQASAIDLRTHVADMQAAVVGSEGLSQVTARDGVAIIDVSGTMMKYSSSMDSGASTVAVRRSVRNAATDPAIKAILVVYDTPGGTVSGTPDLAGDLAIARTKKPVWAFGEDLCASAGYWCASQADHFRANANGSIGSIGVFAAVQDSSGRAEAMRIKMHVIKAGEFKGAGTPGTPITDAQLAEWQRSIDTIYGQFIDAVARGRRMTSQRVQALADGRVHIGQEAVKLGLIDRVSTLDETLADLRGVVVARTVSAPSVPLKGKVMSTETWGVNPAATISELEAAMPNAPAEFLMSQLKIGATVAQATAAYTKALENRIAAGQVSKPIGVTPPRSTASETAEAGDYESLVRDMRSRNPQMSRVECCLAVARKYPEIHNEYMKATNAGGRVQRHIDERFAELPRA